MSTSLDFLKSPGSTPTACTAQSRERAVAVVDASPGNVTAHHVDSLTSKALDDAVILLISLGRQLRYNETARHAQAYRLVSGPAELRPQITRLRAWACAPSQGDVRTPGSPGRVCNSRRIRMQQSAPSQPPELTQNCPRIQASFPGTITKEKGTSNLQR